MFLMKTHTILKRMRDMMTHAGVIYIDHEYYRYIEFIFCYLYQVIALKTTIKTLNLIIFVGELCKQKSKQLLGVDNSFIAEGLPFENSTGQNEKKNTQTKYFFGHIYAQFILCKECAILTDIFYCIYIAIAEVGRLNYLVIF
ncbi:hypothetical protein ACO02O_02654 [Dirofilaria immitis]